MRRNIMVAAMVFGFALTAQASTTGTLLLRGNVPEILSIQVNAEGGATSLDLSTDKTDYKVATVLERSNSSTGYTVSISSLNNGSLVRSGGSESFGYTMKYDGSSVDLSSGASFNNAAAAAVASNKDVTISYTGVASEEMVAGDYEDTVTFTIAAN